ncbi:MAG: tetratricopeptide repeat protein [Actinobacteria bacterium]|nr:tetratricopeptide repeat protein [Actinomycetota bacterium]
MPRALQPRKGRPTRRPGSARPALARDLLDEVRRTARTGKGEAAARHLERAVDMLARGDPAVAVREAESAKELAPRSSAVRETLGLAYYGEERWREALRELQAYRRMTSRVDQNHVMADCERGLKRPERAVPLVMEALDAPRMPEEVTAEAVVVGAAALADVGRFEEALALLRRFRTKPDVGRPHDLRVWYVTGDVLSRAGRAEEAAREFRRVLRFDPAAFDTAERLAQLG